ncbi:MAG TPA: hypothetical protein DCS91_10090 [Microcoleaceae bacterium UBA11344]|jgi:hypothetical protein|nr:hypothetical protein [Microcoleaceae cyanobacterium UBA11344]
MNSAKCQAAKVVERCKYPITGEIWFRINNFIYPHAGINYNIDNPSRGDEYIAHVFNLNLEKSTPEPS